MQPSSELELTAVCEGLGASGKEPPSHPGELSSGLGLQGSPRAAFFALWKELTSGAQTCFLAATWDEASYMLSPGEP